MKSNEFTWRIAGGSGDGIASTSHNFAIALMRAGLDVFTHRHFPSRIRGGHTHVEIRAAPHAVESRPDEYNVLLALGDSYGRAPDEDAYYGNEEIKPLTENLDDLADGGIIVYDTGVIDTEDVENFEERVADHDWHVYPIDLRSIAQEHGRAVMRNTAGVGVIAALVGFDSGYIKSIIDDQMTGAVREQNLAVLADAKELVTEDLDRTHDYRIPTGSHASDQVLVSGSQAIAYGALDAGCRFVSGYPMTPWTEVFTIMSQHLGAYGGIAEQVEDEIGAINIAIGASHAGARAMTGSSGGGFSLMSEAVGLIEQSETPLVVLEAMRSGPSTGMPTKPEQGDLNQVLYSSQGDSARVVLAPSTHREAYNQTRLAFELAYDYHLPVVLVYDQKFSGEYRSVPKAFFDREPAVDPGTVYTEAELEAAPHDASGRFKRYALDAEDVAPRSVPGQRGGRYLASSNEHLPSGHLTEDPDVRTKQMTRRLGKLDAVADRLADAASLQTRFGPEEATYGLITWGTTQDTVKEAVERLTAMGHSVRGIGVSAIKPFPAADLTAFLESVEQAVVVEMNATGQFRGVIQRELGQFGDRLSSLLKYDGEPFTPGEVVDGFTAAALDEPRAALDATLKLNPTRSD